MPPAHGARTAYLLIHAPEPTRTTGAPDGARTAYLLTRVPTRLTHDVARHAHRSGPAALATAAAMRQDRRHSWPAKPRPVSAAGGLPTGGERP